MPRPRGPAALTWKNRQFINEYLAGGMDASRAVRAVNPGAKYPSQTGASWMRNPRIAAEIARGMEDKLTAASYSADELLASLIDLARLDITEIVTLAGGRVEVKDAADIPPRLRRCIKSIKEKFVKTSDDDYQSIVEVEFHDSFKAKEILAQYLKLYGDQKVVVEIVNKREAEWLQALTETMAEVLPDDMLALLLARMEVKRAGLGPIDAGQAVEVKAAPPEAAPLTLAIAPVESGAAPHANGNGAHGNGNGSNGFHSNGNGHKPESNGNGNGSH